MLYELQRRQTVLYDLLRRKDSEIIEYKMDAPTKVTGYLRFITMLKCILLPKCSKFMLVVLLLTLSFCTYMEQYIT